MACNNELPHILYIFLCFSDNELLPVSSGRSDWADAVGGVRERPHITTQIKFLIITFSEIKRTIKNMFLTKIKK